MAPTIASRPNLPAASGAVNWDLELLGAQQLFQSGLLPPDFRSPAAVMFVVLAGRDLGLSPVQSLRSIRIIKGKVECSADLQLGLYHRDGGKSRWLKLDSDGAQLELQAPWMTSPHVSKFGPEEAKRAELLGNSNYKKFPQAMFRSRAITQGLKDIGFLAGAGLYAPGELGGTTLIDNQTGEVLPGEAREPIVQQMLDANIKPLAGSVEALSDDARAVVESVVSQLSQHIADGTIDDALALYETLDNDAKIAAWASMSKAERKAIKTAGIARLERIKAATVTEPVASAVITDAQSGAPDAADIRKLIKKGKLHEAADLLRGLPDDVVQQLRSEIDEMRADIASQP